MKNSILFFALMLVAAALPAQRRFVMETERMMSFGSRPGFRVEFSTSSAKLVEEQWKTFAKKNFEAKLKKDRKTDEWTAANLQSPLLGNSTYAIYSTVEKVGDNGSALTLWIDAGSYFVSSRENASQATEVMGALRQFYFDVRRATIDQEIKDQEAKIKDLENKQKRLERENDGLRKDIDNYKAKIKKAEEDIVKNDKEQESALVDAEKQRRMLEEMRRRRENVENEN